MKTTLIIYMPDGARWGVPVMLIARNRAAHYAKEFDGDIERSLNEDTIPLFSEDDYNIHDWAANNMNWDDVKAYAAKLDADPPEADWQDAWCNAEWEVA